MHKQGWAGRQDEGERKRKLTLRKIVTLGRWLKLTLNKNLKN